MIDDELSELRKLSAHFFNTVIFIFARETYQDELTAELQRIESELEQYRQELTDCTKKIGALILSCSCESTKHDQ